MLEKIIYISKSAITWETIWVIDYIFCKLHLYENFISILQFQNKLLKSYCLNYNFLYAVFNQYLFYHNNNILVTRKSTP